MSDHINHNSYFISVPENVTKPDRTPISGSSKKMSTNGAEIMSSPDITSDEDEFPKKTPRKIRNIIESDSEDESDEFQPPQSPDTPKNSNESPKNQRIINIKDDVLLRTPREVNSIIETDSEDESDNEIISPNSSESELSLHSIENIESDTDVNLGAIPKNVLENSHKSPNKNDANLIEISSSDEAAETPAVVKRQSNLDTLFQQMSVKKSESSEFLEVSSQEYQAQKRKVADLQVDMQKAKNILRTVNLAALPDKGALLVKRHDTGMETLKKEEEKLRLMRVTKGQYTFDYLLFNLFI